MSHIFNHDPDDTIGKVVHTKDGKTVFEPNEAGKKFVEDLEKPTVKDYKDLIQSMNDKISELEELRDFVEAHADLQGDYQIIFDDKHKLEGELSDLKKKYDFDIARRDEHIVELEKEIVEMKNDIALDKELREGCVSPPSPEAVAQGTGVPVEELKADLDNANFKGDDDE